MRSDSTDSMREISHSDNHFNCSTNTLLFFWAPQPLPFLLSVATATAFFYLMKKADLYMQIFEQNLPYSPVPSENSPP